MFKFLYGGQTLIIKCFISGESSYAVANIIALPAVLIFMVFILVIIPSAISDSHDFLPRIFTTNIAIWALFWLGYNLQVFINHSTRIQCIRYGTK